MSNSKKPQFLVGFDPSLSSLKLNIPWKFLPNLEGKTSGTALLTGPSDNIWHVTLGQIDEGLYFHDGWETFATDNFLAQGDSLVFRYDGDLEFTVHVFDVSSCEKEDAFNAVCRQDPNSPGYTRGRKRVNTALFSDTDEAITKRSRSSPVYIDCITKNQGDGTSLANKEVSSQQEMMSFSETHNVGNASKDSVTVAFPLSIIELERSEASTINELRTDFRMMSATEAERIVRAFTSPFPNFTKVMKRFNVGGSYTLNIPYQFATAYLPNCKIKIVLSNLKGICWTVNSIPTTRVQTSHTFCGGWLGFVRDNNINLGDICIFELVRKFELQVRILRVENEGLENLSNEVIQKETLDCSRATLRNRSGRKTKKINGYSHSVYSQQVEIDGILDNNGSQLGSLYSLSTVCSGESDADYVRRQGSQTKGCMSLKSAPEEKLAAKSFVSSYPHFVRIMKTFNVSGSYTLKIPYKFSMEHLPCCKTEIILRNLKGQSWNVNSIPTIKVQTLHTFCGGWMAFVRENCIEVGDICIFELVGRCEMRVHVCSIGNKGLKYRSGGPSSDELPREYLSRSSLA